MLDKFFDSIDYQAWIDGIAAGVPALIALFLVVFAQWAISPKLKEATEAGHGENASLYRNQIRLASRVGIGLFLLHAGFFIYNQINPPQMLSSYIEGKVQELREENQITLINDPDRIYVREAINPQGGVTYYWLIKAGLNGHRPQFRIVTSQNIRYDCKFEKPVKPGREVLLQAVFEDFIAEKISRLEMYQPDQDMVPINCAFSPNQPFAPQETQPATGAPLDFSAVNAGEEDLRQGNLWQRLGLFAHAGSRIDKRLEALLTDLRDDDYRTRDAAQKNLAQNFDQYRDWAEKVATGRYAATEREVMGLVWAMSRLDPLPREGMFSLPDMSAEMIDFALAQAVSDNPVLRESAKRFSITYPSLDMQAMLRAAVTRAAQRRSATRGGAVLGDSAGSQTLDLEKEVLVADALAHFAYNRGVLITMANRDGHADAPPLAEAAISLDQAARLARNLPADMQIQYAKIDYGTGWLNAVAVGEGLGGDFSEAQAQAAFSTFVRKIDGRSSKEYKYPWQLDIAKSYIARPDYGLFNK